MSSGMSELTDGYSREGYLIAQNEAGRVKTDGEEDNMSEEKKKKKYKIRMMAKPALTSVIQVTAAPVASSYGLK